NLVFLGGLQIYIGFQLPMIDNAAHVGGVIGGAVMAFIVAPEGLLGDRRMARWLLRALALAGAVLLVWAAVAVARTPLRATLEKIRLKTEKLGSVEVDVPTYWVRDSGGTTVGDPYLDLELSLRQEGTEARWEAKGPAGYDWLVERIERSRRPQ